MKRPNPVDEHVGLRLKMRRLMLDTSLAKVASFLGVTSQQVQKYEAGKTRLGASHLQQLSVLLQMPVAFFFEGVPEHRSDHVDDGITRFVATPEGLDLSRAFLHVPSSELRRSIVLLVQQLASQNV
jgi:transcriptional regulator with XRE-family HTH domain